MKHEFWFLLFWQPGLIKSICRICVIDASSSMTIKKTVRTKSGCREKNELRWKLLLLLSNFHDPIIAMIRWFAKYHFLLLYFASFQLDATDKVFDWSLHIHHHGIQLCVEMSLSYHTVVRNKMKWKHNNDSTNFVEWDRLYVLYDWILVKYQSLRLKSQIDCHSHGGTSTNFMYS